MIENLDHKFKSLRKLVKPRFTVRKHHGLREQ
jgi:hypothetical protein